MAETSVVGTDPVYHTTETVRELNARQRSWWPKYEAAYGELLVTPAPTVWHEVVQGRIMFALMQYVERERLPLYVVGSRSETSWGRGDTLVQPDAFVVPIDEARTMDWSRLRSLTLVVEVLSPSTARHDRFAKRRLYQQQGVPLYWIVDGDAREVEVWTPEAQFPMHERERLVWHPAGAEEPFTLALAELFRPL